MGLECLLESRAIVERWRGTRLNEWISNPHPPALLTLGLFPKNPGSVISVGYVILLYKYFMVHYVCYVILFPTGYFSEILHPHQGSDH